jgi:hypothetical protein
MVEVGATPYEPASATAPIDEIDAAVLLVVVHEITDPFPELIAEGDAMIEHDGAAATGTGAGV